MKVVRPLVEAELPSSNKPTTKLPPPSVESPTKKVKPDAPPTTLDAQLVPMLYMAVCQDTLVTPSTSGLQRFRNAAAKQLGADGAIALHGLNLGPRAGSVLARCVTNARAIDLRGNAMLADQGALALFPLLEHGTLRALDLSGCGLRGAFAPALARTLLRSKGGAGAQLQELQLGGGGAAPKAVAQPGEAGGGGGELVRPNRLHCVGSLAAALQERAPRLRLLGLGHNALGAAPPELVDASVLGLAALLSNARQLKSVDLSHNGFSAAAAAPLLHSSRAPRSPASTSAAMRSATRAPSFSARRRVARWRRRRAAALPAQEPVALRRGRPRRRRPRARRRCAAAAALARGARACGQRLRRRRGRGVRRRARRRQLDRREMPRCERYRRGRRARARRAARQPHASRARCRGTPLGDAGALPLAVASSATSLALATLDSRAAASPTVAPSPSRSPSFADPSVLRRLDPATTC